MKNQKVLENYFDSRIYNNQEIEEAISKTKKEFEKKIVNVDISLNEFGVYVVTYYFKNKENLFQKIVIKIKQRKKKKQMLLLQEKKQKMQERQFELQKKEIKKQRKKENKQKNHIEKAKRKNKTREEKNKEKLQKRIEKYTGNKYGKYKEKKTYRPY